MHKGDLIKFNKKRKYWELEDYQTSVKKLQNLGWTQEEIEQFINVKIEDGEPVAYYWAGQWNPFLPEGNPLVKMMDKNEQIEDLKRIINGMVFVFRQHRMSDRTMERIIKYAKETYDIDVENRIDWPSRR